MHSIRKIAYTMVIDSGFRLCFWRMVPILAWYHLQDLIFTVAATSHVIQSGQQLLGGVGSVDTSSIDSMVTGHFCISFTLHSFTLQ
jgi:hypothetical protein